MNYLAIIRTYLPKLTSEELVDLKNTVEKLIPEVATKEIEYNDEILKEAVEKLEKGEKTINVVHFLKTRTEWPLRKCIEMLGLKDKSLL